MRAILAPATRHRQTYSPRRCAAMVGIVLALLGAIGWATIDDYGLTPDDTGAIFMAKWHYDLVTNGTPLERPIVAYDGTLVSFAAEAVHQVRQWRRMGDGYSFKRTFSTKEFSVARIIRDRTPLRHAMVLASSLLTALAAAALVWLIAGPKYAWLAPIVLALVPQFWGHSIINFKDIPLAALFTVATLAGGWLIVAMVRANDREWGARLWMTTTACGALLGLACAVRVGALVLIGFLAIAHAFLLLTNRIWPRHLFRLCGAYAAILIIGLGIMFLFYPAAWVDPAGWFMGALSATADYPRTKPVLFAGVKYPASELPWRYLPTWVAITIPEITLGLALIGGLAIARRWHSLSDLQRTTIVLLGMQLLAIPLAAIIGGSTMYDGMRHSLFIIPPIAVLACAGFAAAMQTGRVARLATVAIVTLALGLVGWDMVRLHPYEYAYFNRSFGGLPAAYRRYEIDYWGLSMREAIEWICRNGDPRLPIVVGGPESIAKPMASPGWKVVSYEPKPLPAPPFYYAALPKHQHQAGYPDAPLIYAVRRDGVPMTTVQLVERVTPFAGPALSAAPSQR